MPPGRGNRNTDGIDEDSELQASEELLARLTKQYRMMERNRRQYYDETTVLLTKQRKMLSELEAEQQKLEESLAITKNNKNVNQDIRAGRTMSAILDRQSYYERLIDDEKEKIQDIESRTTQVEKQLRESRRTMPSRKTLDNERETGIVANKALENRIQQATVRLNAILAKNSKYRVEIEKLLKEKDKFQFQAKRMERKLMSTSRRKHEVMDQVTKAYSEREEAQTKIRTLRERVDRDSAKFSNELRKLQRAVDHQKDLKSFVNTICAGEEEEIGSRQQDVDGLAEGGMVNTLETYRASISHLQEMSNEESVENLLTNYLQVDNDNYTLFSFISNLNNEATSITNDVSKMQQEIEETKGKSTKIEVETKNNLEKLTNECTSLKENISDLQEQIQKSTEALGSLQLSTKELFDLLQCDPKPIQGLVGSVDVVTSSNLTVFLSVIEQRVQELVQLRTKIWEEASPSSGFLAASVDDDSDGQSGSSPSSLGRMKPIIPHVAHTIDDEANGPVGHGKFMSSLRQHLSINTDPRI